MSKNYLKLIGARIRELRKEQGLTQEDVADMAKLNPSYYGRIERGEINVTVDTLLKIADALKVDLTSLLGLPQLKNDLSEKELRAKLRKVIENEKAERLQALIMIMEMLSRWGGK